MTLKRLHSLLLLLTVILLSGCDPFGDAEKNFPLPVKIWDRATPVKGYKLFQITGMTQREFLNIKVLLSAEGFSEQKRDFHFASADGKTPLTIKSAGSVLLLKKSQSSETESNAAVYIEKEQKLLLGTGIAEQ